MHRARLFQATLAAIWSCSFFGQAIHTRAVGETVLSQATAGHDAAEMVSAAEGTVHFRGSLKNSREVFAVKKRGCVAFLGGSITEMDGYRPMVMQSLKKRFPGTEFEFVNAGIGSTCSHSGAFRLRSHVLDRKPDLLLVEFAVNDDQDAAHDFINARRGMEGVIRNARKSLPKTDIVMVHFVNQGMLKMAQQGRIPTSIRAHESVAAHYGISSCDVAAELATQINDGKTSWKIYGGVHPKPAGNRIAADLVDQVFDHFHFNASGSGRVDQNKVTTAIPSAAASETATGLPAPLDSSSFSEGRFLPESALQLESGWVTHEPDWKNIHGSMRSRFTNRTLTAATEPGSEMTATFDGTAVGLFILAGPDAGTVEYSVDGEGWKTKDLYHRFSKGLHYPRTVVLESGLQPGRHQLKLRVSKQNNPASKGHAVRVLHFVAS